jgi:hypothetical protein
LQKKAEFHHDVSDLRYIRRCQRVMAIPLVGRISAAQSANATTRRYRATGHEGRRMRAAAMADGARAYSLYEDIDILR